MPSTQQQNNKVVLPVAPAAAVQQLIRISQSLLTVAEKETQALLTNDMLAFSIIQYEKEKLAREYGGASEAFRARLEEFRTVDPNLIARLEKLQGDLGEKANANNALVDHVRKRAFASTQKTLNTARELSQSARVRYDEIPSSQETSTEGA